ncbi:MAG: hypothetical protein M3Y76_07410 [Chloroflexota bacterium]|nr:hypothetical protein [Chloroflexota bacterium]
MSTKSAKVSVASSTVLVKQKNAREATSEEDKQTKPHRRWDRRDALYLLILLGLVVAMALHYTPNFTGEVAGLWWDPLLNMWTMVWDTTTLLHAPLHLWQAQLLYPNNNSLSLSENLLGETIFFAPIFLSTHNPVLAYNITFYLTFLLCGINMYIMARHYTGKPFAAFVAALIYAFSPYRLGQIDHIHIIAGEWMPLAFLYLDLSLEHGRWRHWILFALFYLLQLLSSIYYGIFLSYALLAYVLFRYAKPFVTQLRSKKGAYLKFLLLRGVRPAIILTVMVLFLGILMAPYLLSLRHGFSRSLDQTANYSATLRDFGFAVPFNWLYGFNVYRGKVIPLDSEHYLFLGLVTLALAASGMLLAFWRKSIALRPYIWTALIVLLFAFGPTLHYTLPGGSPYSSIIPISSMRPNTPMPWMLAYYVLPGFAGLRVPARLIGVLLIMLATLSAYAVSWLQSMSLSSQKTAEKTNPQSPVESKTFHRHTRFFVFRGIAIQCLLVVLPFAILLEALPAYMPVTQVPTGNAIPLVYQWLASHGDQQPLVELPIAATDRNFETKNEAWYDYYAIYHSHPIVNGWSGYRPSLTSDLSTLLMGFPSERSVSALKQFHIQYVVLHLQYYSPTEANSILARVESSSDLRRVAVFGNDSVWQVI